MPALVLTRPDVHAAALRRVCLKRRHAAEVPGRMSVDTAELLPPHRHASDQKRDNDGGGVGGSVGSGVGGGGESPPPLHFLKVMPQTEKTMIKMTACTIRARGALAH